MQADYVIVGAGSAGCVLANRLSADPGQPGHSDRGRRARLEPADPHPGRLCETARPSEADLGLHRRTRSRRQQPRDPLSARPRGRRLVVDQRHDLCPRPARGFRPLGPARQSRLVVGRRAPVFQARRKLAGGRQRLSRIGRAAADLAYLRQAGAVRADHPGRAGDRSRIPRGRQPPAAELAGRHRLGAADPPRPAPPERGAHLSAPGLAAAEPASRHRRAGASRAVRRQARGRRRILAWRQDRARRGAGRGDPVGRRDRLAAYPATLRGRRPRPSRPHRRAGRACAAGGRQEFAGPFSRPRHGRGAAASRPPTRSRAGCRSWAS